MISFVSGDIIQERCVVKTLQVVNKINAKGIDMATEIYFGKIPQNVRKWIEEKKEKEKEKEKTIVTFDDGETSSYGWSGVVTQDTLVESGIYDSDSEEWVKNIV